MPFLLLVLIYKFVAVAIRTIIAKRKEQAQSMCSDCFYAHVQYGSEEQRAISCTYGGALRLVTIDVLYCTDYCSRDAPKRGGAIRFVREISPAG